MAKIIAFSGKAGSGKDTAAEVVKRHYPGTVHLSFAAPLKEMATKYFPFCDVITKDPLSRTTLQGLGTLMREEVDENYWVNKLLSSIEDRDDAVYVITDLRYKNEYRQLLNLSDVHEVFIIRLEGRKYNQDQSNMEHPSETELDNMYFQFVYNNTGTLEDLEVAVMGVLKGYYVKETK